MKRTLIIFISTALTCLSCEKPETFAPPQSGKMMIEIFHHIDGKEINYGNMDHTAASGQRFQVDYLNYFASNFSFHKKGEGWTVPGHFRLVKRADNNSRFIEIKDLPFAGYDSLRFFIGLDSVTNHSMDRAAELDPDGAMVWPMSSEYIFMMFEGKFINKQNKTIVFAYHIATDSNRMEYTLPIGKSVVLGADNPTGNLKIRLNMGEIFRTPNAIDLDSIMPVITEGPVIELLSRNLLDAAQVE